MTYAFINQSVGKYGKNIKEDVMSIQIRLNRWIMEGKLPDVPMLAVDGDCGPQTRKSIGAFQKLYVGLNSPDCRVDPKGPTLDKLFQSLISPQASHEAYQAWLKAQAAASQNAASPDVDWWKLTAAEVAEIRRHWGEEALAWAKIPPNGTETSEFVPHKQTDRFAVLFGWKSLTPKTACWANPGQSVQFLALLRDDMAFWRQRTHGNERMAIILKDAAACAIRDYRLFIIDQKMCPQNAYNRLVLIGKDVTFQMFLGMFQLLSPVGVAGAPASSRAIAEGVDTVIKRIQTGKWPWTQAANG